MAKKLCHFATPSPGGGGQNRKLCLFKTTEVMGMLVPGSTLFSLLNSSDLQSDAWKEGFRATLVCWSCGESLPSFSCFRSFFLLLCQDVVSLDLFVNGSVIKDLITSVHLSIPGDSQQNQDCAYFDEVLQEWSTAGVSLISASNVSITCATTHLSIFGAIAGSILQALICSNAAAIFSIEGLRSLGSRAWYLEASAVLNWVALLVGFVLLYFARKADVQHKERLRLAKLVSNLKGGHQGLQDENHDDDHHSSAWEQLLEELRVFTDNGPARIVYSQMIRVETGLPLKALAKLYKKSGHTELHCRAETFLRNFGNKSCMSKFKLWYGSNCKFISFQYLHAKSTSMVRCSVLLGKIYSGWALSAMFYGASSIAPGAEETGCFRQCRVFLTMPGYHFERFDSSASKLLLNNFFVLFVIIFFFLRIYFSVDA